MVHLRPGHTGKKAPELLAEAGKLGDGGRKRKREDPIIELVQQPPQSPDFNICDLAFFRALSVAVPVCASDAALP